MLLVFLQGVSPNSNGQGLLLEGGQERRDGIGLAWHACAMWHEESCQLLVEAGLGPAVGPECQERKMF